MNNRLRDEQGRFVSQDQAWKTRMARLAQYRENKEEDANSKMAGTVMMWCLYAIPAILLYKVIFGW